MSKNCKSDKIINPITGRCVKRTGKIGKQILSESKNNVESESKNNVEPKSKTYKKSKSECVRQHGSKYIKRKSPPFPANKCKNQYRAGNDGLLWFSKANIKGVHRWVPIT